MSHSKVWAALTALFVVAGGSPGPSPPLLSQGQSSMSTPDQALEAMARSAKVEDPDSIRALTHAVVTSPHVYKYPIEVTVLLEYELARNETRYRSGLGHGVREEQLVDFLNELAAKFQVPSYVTTTPAQVRNLRMRLATKSPYFMGAGLTSHSLKKGESINTELSPLQAMHLFNVMIDQKILNDLYQDPSTDIVRVEQERHEAYRREALASGNKALVKARSNPRALEVRTAISRGIESMSVSDALDLANSALKAFGLK